MDEHATATFEDFFSECYLQYRNVLRRYISSRIFHSFEAEDITQDVFIRLWEYRTFVNRETIRPLLFTMAQNLIIDKIRRHYKKEDFVSYIYNVQEVNRNAVEEDVFAHELETLHCQVVGTLPVKRRQIYKLSFHGMASPAIADKLSLSVRTVEGQLLMARKTVRTYVKQQLVG